MSEPTVTERLAAIEAELATFALPRTMATLQRKLEATWQPEAGVLLQPGSILPDSMAGVVDSDGKGFTLGGIHVRWGTGTVVWAGGTPFATVAATHGMVSTPTVAVAGDAGGGTMTTNIPVWSSVTGATTLAVAAETSDASSPAAAATRTFYWIAIG